MSDKLRRACLMASVPILVIFASPSVAQLWSPLSSKPSPHMSKPKVSVLCLPPGGTKPVPCGAASVGPTLAIRIDEDLPPGGAILRFRARPVELEGQPVDVRLAPMRRGQIRQIAVPRQMCSGRSQGNFEIQVMTSEFNQAESVKGGDADSVGFFQMRC